MDITSIKQDLTELDATRTGWNDVAIDDDMKQTFQVLLQRSIRSIEQSHGILKTGQIGGALLYGPPVTGKTHLVRVLAHEIGRVLFTISSSDIRSKWVGETEKTIRGLFDLARILAPSMIFINEADALLKA